MVIQISPNKLLNDSLHKLERIHMPRSNMSIHIEATGLHELFKKSLKLMSNKLKSGIYCPTRHVDCTMKIQINAMDSKTLLNKFLNQVLEFTYAQHAIFCTMYIEELTERKLNAQLFGNWFDTFDKKLKFVSKNDIFLRENKDEDNTFISSISFECE